MEDLRGANWDELNARLFEGAWKEPLRRFRSDCVFRGEGDAAWDLNASVSRLGPAAERLEGYLLRNFRKYAPRDAAGDDSIWSWPWPSITACRPGCST